MHFIIMGCGRVGATLARELTDMGHSVAIIDQNSEAFQRLPADFQGQRITGQGFDRDVLERAGVEDAYGFAAVSSGDNSNIIAARVVREEYGVKNVVTRIYDPSRAAVYGRLGIDTVPTVKWTVDQVMRRLIPLGPYTNYSDEIAQMSLITVDTHTAWYGLTVEHIENATHSRVAYITRASRGLLPTPATVLHDGDIVNLITPSENASTVQYVLTHEPKEEML